MKVSISKNDVVSVCDSCEVQKSTLGCEYLSSSDDDVGDFYGAVFCGETRYAKREREVECQGIRREYPADDGTPPSQNVTNASRRARAPIGDYILHARDGCAFKWE